MKRPAEFFGGPADGEVRRVRCRSGRWPGSVHIEGVEYFMLWDTLPGVISYRVSGYPLPNRSHRYAS